MNKPGVSDALADGCQQAANDSKPLDGNRFRAVSSRWVVAAWIGAVLALLIQQWLEPFTAGSHMGLFTNGGDLDIYRHGALQVVRGDPLYAEPIPPGGWFTYPPFAALTFIPLSLLAFPPVQVLWMSTSFVALAATIWRCGTVLGYRSNWQLGLLSVAMSLAAVDIEAVRGSLWQGQVNLVLMAIIVWDLTRPRGARLRGWSVGLAAGIKLTAIVFVPHLVMTRQWRAAAIATTTACTTVLATWCLLPHDSTTYWFHAVFDTDRIGPLTHPGNFSIGGVLATLSAPAPMSTAAWLGGVTVAAVLGYYAAHRAEAHGSSLIGVTIIGLLSCTVPPLAWGHHWVWTVPLLAITVDRIVRSAGLARWGWIVATAGIYLLVFMWFNAWLYVTALRLNGQYPSYVQALDAAIGQMSRSDKLLAVGVHPLLFVVVALAVAARGRVTR